MKKNSLIIIVLIILDVIFLGITISLALREATVNISEEHPISIPKYSCVDRFPEEFRNTAIRGSAGDITASEGNTKEAFEIAGANGVKHAEADFRLNLEGILIATHDEFIGGTCGLVSKKTLVELQECRLEKGYHVATLTDFLRQPFYEVYIDLKNTNSTDDKIVLQAVQSAVEVIKQTDRSRSAVVMMYRVTPEVIELLHKNNIRSGMKGYPDNRQETMSLVHTAAGYCFELVCIPLAQVSPSIIRESAQLKVWHLAWDMDKPDLALWRARAEQGLGGLISPYYPLVAEEVSDYWQSLQDLLRE